MKEISLVLFHDSSNIVMQKRGNHSKYGEKYGFWGGGRQKNERPVDTALRELSEELGYKPKHLEFWRSHKFEFDGEKFRLHLFLSPITTELLNTTIKEGDGLVITSFDKILLSDEFDQVDKDIISDLKKFLITGSHAHDKSDRL